MSDRSNPNVNPDEVKFYPKNDNQLMCYLAAEGHRILAAEERASKKSKAEPLAQPSKVLETKLASMSSNPYVKARVAVLNEMSESKRILLERMEKDGDTDNRIYTEFSNKVTRLAESKFKG